MTYKTRADFESAPQLKPRNWGHLSLKAFADSLKVYADNAGDRVPEAEAVSFYALNQLSAVIRSKFTLNEPLSPLALDVYSLYYSTLAQQARRQLSYIALISNREARHMNSKDEFWATQKGKYVGDFSALKKFIGSLPDSASEAVEKFKNSAPDVQFGNFVTALTTAFNTKGHWHGGYGGPPWGNIANCMRAFVCGETSAEILVDTAYTLAHNNGPMYNKGMLYSMYSAYLERILDVQRAGMVCEAVLSDDIIGKYKTIGVHMLVEKVKKEYPESIGDQVDWARVQELGAKGSYVVVPPKPKKPVFVEFGGKKYKPAGSFSTGLGDSYPIIDREKVA